MSVQRFQHGSGATYVLESDYLATVADADLRYENGARNQRLIDEARIRDLEAALQRICLEVNNLCDAQDIMPDEIAEALKEAFALVGTPAETKGEQGA